MKIDATSAVALRAVLEADLASIAQLTESLRGLGNGPLGEPEAIAAGYYLHNLYNALENSFDQISRTFENHVKDLSRWHQELLHKMFLDMPPLRPAVLPSGAKPLLDDLRGFRHRFRHSYDYPLDAAKVAALARRWIQEGPPVCASLRGFAAGLAGAAAAGFPAPCGSHGADGNG
jgi:hypothetical protein